jgi:threonine synthase
MKAWLACTRCAAKFDLGPMFFGCPHCAAALVVRSGDAPWDGKTVTLGEGSTPLIPLRDWSGPARFFVKNESCNPTWSYKDRTAPVSISMAREFGFTQTVAISTGNHGNAVAAYSAAAGLGCTIFCNPGAPELQLALMRRYGARVVRGGNQDALVRQMVQRGGVFPATIVCPLGGFANPYGVEGFKPIAIEIVNQLGRVPDRVFAPAGSGDGLYGIWKGFWELREFGMTYTVPKMIGCQAEGAACYAEAIRTGAPEPVHIREPKTVALSIAEEVGGSLALDAIRESGGTAIAVSDEAILAAMRRLSGCGMALEAASATALACADTIAAEGSPEETWVMIGTGAIAKWPPMVTQGFPMPPALPPDFSDWDLLSRDLDAA